MNTLLLLEDDFSLVDGLVYSLKKNDYSVEVARTVQEALALLPELDRFDLLILDVTLPDGTEQYYDYNYWGLVEEQGYERDGERYGKVINTYNTIGELLKQTAEDGKENVYEYNMLGQLSKVEDESGVRLYSYNDRGLLSTEYSGNYTKTYKDDQMVTLKIGV